VTTNHRKAEGEDKPDVVVPVVLDVAKLQIDVVVVELLRQLEEDSQLE
jgi:hypothetical protein